MLSKTPIIWAFFYEFRIVLSKFNDILINFISKKLPYND